MSRENKFRLYSKLAEKYIEYITIGFSKNGKLRSYSTENGVGPVLDDDYIVEQGTGLLDRNGKEIYEGDIVKNVEGVNETAVCVWDESNAEFDFRCKDGKYTRDNVKSWLEMYEIVGNIHESNMEELCPKE